MSLVLVSLTTGSCSLLRLRPGGAISITASVGINGANHADDVRTIQEALNDVSPADGGPVPSLKVDEIPGPKTQGAIQKFQLKHFGWPGADGRVDPNKHTIAKLNEVLGAGGGGTPQVGALRTGPERLEFVRKLLPEVLASIRAARFQLTLATPFIDKSPGAGSFAAGSSVALVNRHFALDKLPPDNRRAGILRIAAVYDTMLSVFARPGGLWGFQIFDFDSPADAPPTAQAYTRAGGFFRGGESEDGKRVDAIYLLDHFDRMPRDRNLRNLVHELAHFVGATEGPGSIKDLAYGWFDDRTPLHDAPKAMSRLSPEERMRTAESYRNFVYETKFKGRPAGTL